MILGKVPIIMGIDVSSYQKSVDYPLLFAKGIRFVIIKITQGNYLLDKKAYDHFNQAAQAGLIAGFYHWHDPSRMEGAQGDYYLSAVQDLPYAFTALDVEQYWSDWSTWPKAPKVGFSPEKISSTALTLAQYIKSQSRKPLIIYTRPTFIMDYARPMLIWIDKFPTWYATYPYKSGLETLTWESFAGRLPDPAVQGPFFPKGWPADKKAWLFWQFTGDKFCLPGCPSPLDVNYFNGDQAALNTLAGVVPAPPVLTIEQRLTSLEERVSRLETAALAQGWVL